MAYDADKVSERRPVTLKEISARVGVSPSSASVVLNGAKSRTKVSEETRQAILEVARELNYRPNVLARSLRQRRTGIVGFFSGYDQIDPRNLYVAELMHGIQAGCARQGLHLLLFTPNASHAAEEVVASLADGRLDGLVVTALPGHPITKLLAQERLPVVAIADRLPGIASVLADSDAAGRLQARHLRERGHRRVLYVPSDYPFPSVLDRQASFVEEAGRLGIDVEIGTPVAGHLPREKIDAAVLRRDERIIERLLLPDRPTAIQCWEDSPAYRLASRLSSLGLNIPKDIAIMGHNGNVPAPELRWNLTTVRAPWPALGEAAVAVLHAAIEGATFPQTTVLPVELVVGATT